LRTDDIGQRQLQFLVDIATLNVQALAPQRQSVSLFQQGRGDGIGIEQSCLLVEDDGRH
jgi:hypothetical protein